VVVIELKEVMPEAVEAMHHTTWMHCSSKRIDAIIINFHTMQQCCGTDSKLVELVGRNFTYLRSVVRLSLQHNAEY